jgi:SPP1 gp7 family putative phage head morphogenesis protein
MPETTKKPIKIVPNTIKTIPKIKPATIIPKKTLEDQLEEIYDEINIDIDDLPDELLEVYEELEGTYKEKSIQKNWKLWLSMFTPFILPAFIKGVSGQVTLPYDARQSVQSNAPEPKVVVDHAKRYFESRGLELVKTLSKTDCERLKVQLKDNWGKGPDAFKKSFQEDYANTNARLDSIYRTEYVTAQNEGILARSRDAGHKFKQWNAALDERTCPVCGDQLHGTIIPIDEEFSAVVEHKNGSEEISVNGPPAHPNCRCVLTTLDEDDYDEIKEDSAYLEDVFETIKLNYKCKAGTVDDSNKCNLEQTDTTNTVTLENKKIASFISNALQKDPRRMFHGYVPQKGKLLTTNDTGFWLDAEGKSYVHKKLGDIPENKRNDLINVHSHAGQDREQLIVNKKDVANFKNIESFSGGDFQMLQFNIKNGYGRKIAVIVAPDEYDYFEVPEEKLGEFIKIKDITNKFEAHSSSLEESRKFLMEISNKNGFVYKPAIKFEQKQDSSYLADAFETIKLNYKCKVGTVDDSNKCEPIDSKNNHIESYSKILESKVPKKFGDQVYLVRMGSEKENNTNIAGNVFVGNNINMLIKKALESSKESGNLIIGRCSKDAFEDDEIDKISKNDFSVTSRYLGQSFSPVDVVIDTGTSDTIYKRSKDELEKEKNLFIAHESQLNKIEQNTALSDYRNFGYRSVNNVLRKNYIVEGENKKSILDPTPVYSKEYIDKALKNASLISDAMEPSKENKTLKRADGAAVTATLFPVSGITEELTNYFKTTYEKGGKYPKTEDILSGNIKPPSEKTWDSYFTSKLKDLEFKDPAFSSTSKSESGIKEDLLVSSDELSPYGITSLLDIKVPKGIRLVDMQERLGIGEGRYKTEKEVLLDKNTIFKIKSVKLEPHDNGMFARIKVTAIQKLPEPIKENSTSNNILVYFENSPIKSMDIAYLYDVVEYIKLNYNCPDSEKTGSGPGSCGGNKPNGKHEPEKPIFDGVPKDLKLGKEFESAKQAVSRNEFKFKTEKKQGMYDTVYKINVIPKKIPTEWKNKKDTLDDKNIWYDPTYMKEVPFGNGKSTVVIPINPEIENQMKLPSGKEEGYLFRGMSYEEFEGIKKNGYIKTDAQYNFDFQGDMTFFSDEKSTASNYASGFAPWQYAPTIDKPAIMIKVKDPGNHEKGTTEGEIGIRGKISDELITEVYIGRPVSMVEGYFEIVDDKYNNNVYRGNASTYKSSVIWKIIPYNKQKQDSSYLEDVTNFIKLNYKCPKGTVDDTNACGLEGQTSKPSETFIGFKSDHDFSSPQDIEANKRIQASLDKAAEPLKKFKPEDRRILKQYSVNSYIDVNQYLNGTLEKEVDQDSSILRHVKEDVDALDKLFSEANLQEPLVTYRGLKDDIIVKNPELRDALDTPGSQIEFPCFSSTSALPFMANNFAVGYNGRLLELQLPTGTKALFIAEESGLPNEFEILVNRGTKFEVVETRHTDIIPPNNGSYVNRSTKRVKITTIKAIV